MIDNDHHACASRVAAGIVNPLSGHRLNLTTGFNQFLQSAKDCYTALERDLGARFWSDVAQLRLIRNPGQLQYLEKRKLEAAYSPFLGDQSKQHRYFPNSVHGVTEIFHTYQLDVSGLMHKMRSWLGDRDSITINKVDYQELDTSGVFFSVGHVNARKIIFCEGYQAIQNPWLRELPFKLSKGEVLTVIPDIPVCQMLNWGHWLVPTNQGYRLGASYDWNDVRLKPVEKTRSQLLASMQQHTGIHASCEQHRVGIRPTTLNRMPFIGPLSNLANAYCFNGFGSKGCLTVPAYAKQLVEHLETAKPLPRELSHCL